METKKSALGPATRLEMGAVILEAAELVDTTPISKCLNAFKALQDHYGGAQRKVETIEGRAASLQAEVAQGDANQDEAVEGLARTLVMDGHPRSNPFEAFGFDSPSLIKKLPYAEKAATIQQLAAAAQGSKMVGQASRDAAKVAKKAARALLVARGPLDKVNAVLKRARSRRDAIGEQWDKSYAVLKRRTHSAADEGAPGLPSALFGRLVRPKKKAAKPAPAPATTPATDSTTPAATPVTPTA